MSSSAIYSSPLALKYLLDSVGPSAISKREITNISVRSISPNSNLRMKNGLPTQPEFNQLNNLLKNLLEATFTKRQDLLWRRQYYQNIGQIVEVFEENL